MEKGNKVKTWGAILTVVLMGAMLVTAFLIKDHRGAVVDHISEWSFGWLLTRLAVPLLIPTVWVIIAIISSPLHRLGIHIKPNAVGISLTVLLAYMALGSEVYGWFSTTIFFIVILFSAFVCKSMAEEFAPYCPHCYTGLIHVERTATGQSETLKTIHRQNVRYALSPDAPFEKSQQSWTDLFPPNDISNTLARYKENVRRLETYPVYRITYNGTYDQFERYYDCICKRCKKDFKKTHLEEESIKQEIVNSERDMESLKKARKMLADEEIRVHDPVEEERRWKALMESNKAKKKKEKTIGSILSKHLGEAINDMTGNTKRVAERSSWDSNKIIIRDRKFGDSMRDDVHSVKESNGMLDFFWSD